MTPRQIVTKIHNRTRQQVAEAKAEGQTAYLEALQQRDEEVIGELRSRQQKRWRKGSRNYLDADRLIAKRQEQMRGRERQLSAQARKASE